MNKTYGPIAVFILLLVVGIFPTFAQDESPTFASRVVFYEVNSVATLRDDVDGASLMNIRPNDIVEILASSGGDHLVNLYRETQTARSFEQIGFGWVERADASLRVTSAPNIVRPESSLTDGGVQVAQDTIVHFGTGWAYSLASAQGSNVLLEGRPLGSTNDDHHYWGLVDNAPGAGEGSMAEDAQISGNWVTNGVATFEEGTLWLFPPTWNVSNTHESDAPVAYEFAEQKRLAGELFDIYIHEGTGYTHLVTEAMLDGTIPQMPDDIDGLLPISVTGIRQADDSVIISSIGVRNACFLVIGQLDRDRSVEVERHCGMQTGFVYYMDDELPTFFWMLPDMSNYEEAAALAWTEIETYAEDFIGINNRFYVDATDASGRNYFGDELTSGWHVLGVE